MSSHMGIVSYCNLSLCFSQQGQTVKNLAMSNESYLQVVSQGKHQGKTQEDNEDHRDIEVTTKTQVSP